MKETECCMCGEKGKLPPLEVLKKENIYQLNKLTSQPQAKLLLELGFEETDCFCWDCFWK